MWMRSEKPPTNGTTIPFRTRRKTKLTRLPPIWHTNRLSIEQFHFITGPVLIIGLQFGHGWTCVDIWIGPELFRSVLLAFCSAYLSAVEGCFVRRDVNELQLGWYWSECLTGPFILPSLLYRLSIRQYFGRMDIQFCRCYFQCLLKIVYNQ